MFKIFSITEKRKEQLDKEYVIDKYITQVASEKCPTTALKFILNARKVNRDQYDEMLDDNMFTKCDKMSNNIDKLNIVFDDIINQGSENICDSLLKHMNFINQT